MSKKDQKQELTQKLGMEFNEATELFSEETLSSMQMNKMVGGDVPNSACLISNSSCANRGACVNYRECNSSYNDICTNYAGGCGGSLNGHTCLGFTTSIPTTTPLPTTTPEPVAA